MSDEGKKVIKISDHFKTDKRSADNKADDEFIDKLSEMIIARIHEVNGQSELTSNIGFYMAGTCLSIFKKSGSRQNDIYETFMHLWSELETVLSIRTDVSPERIKKFRELIILFIGNLGKVEGFAS